jgi:hypothetical protein
MITVALTVLIGKQEFAWGLLMGGVLNNSMAIYP